MKEEAASSGSTSSDRVYMLGELEFDAASGQLTTPEEVVRLPRQPAMLLHALVERAGEVVTREEIQELLWPANTVEYDQGINFCIRRLRSALGDSADDPRFIETFPKRGYRFIGPVTIVGAQRKTSTWSRLALGGIGMAGAALVVMLVIVFQSSPEAGAAGNAFMPPVVAVFPHRNPQAVPVLDTLSLAGAETMTTRLTTEFTGALRVLGPTATIGIAGTDSETGDARRDLAACYTVSGSLRPGATARVVVFTQLIRTADGAHLWAASDTVRPVDVNRTLAAHAGSAGTSMVDGGTDAARCVEGGDLF